MIVFKKVSQSFEVTVPPWAFWVPKTRVSDRKGEATATEFLAAVACGIT
jgi:hypothetical protein